MRVSLGDFSSLSLLLLFKLRDVSPCTLYAHQINTQKKHFCPSNPFFLHARDESRPWNEKMQPRSFLCLHILTQEEKLTIASVICKPNFPTFMFDPLVCSCVHPHHPPPPSSLSPLFPKHFLFRQSDPRSLEEERSSPSSSWQRVKEVLRCPEIPLK